MTTLTQTTKQAAGYGLPALEDIATLFTDRNSNFFNNVVVVAASGAIPVANGTYFITKAGVAALTLVAPTTAQNGTIIEVVSTTANAHTLTATGILLAGVAAKSTATFAAFAGAGIVLTAYNGNWYVGTQTAITLS